MQTQEILSCRIITVQMIATHPFWCLVKHHSGSMNILSYWVFSLDLDLFPAGTHTYVFVWAVAFSISSNATNIHLCSTEKYIPCWNVIKELMQWAMLIFLDSLSATLLSSLFCYISRVSPSRLEWWVRWHRRMSWAPIQRFYTVLLGHIWTQITLS